jgi:uncharacterized membrane protein (UPF0136 family)
MRRLISLIILILSKIFDHSVTAVRSTVARKQKVRQNERMIPWPILLLYIYGILLIVGGLMGYVKAKSVPSLVAGVGCGVIALLLGYRYAWHFAPHAALVLSLLLIFLMGRRYLRTRKAMPALLIVVLSVVVALAQVYVLVFVGAGSEPL